MKKNPYQRVGVFVDVQNMYYSAKNLYGSKVNFAKILEDALSGRQLIRAICYVVRAEEPLEQTFFDALEKGGYEVKVKDIQVFPGGVKKADWDVGVVIDMIRLSNKLDVMVLVSGDGDYVPAVEFLRNQGHRVEVMSFGPSTSNKLKSEADEFIDLDNDNQKYLLTASRTKRSGLKGLPNR
ncbi:NYN domain-containing protein [Patescibacteria group bacterium]|nr:NYN domain-containing protein [Patescibacteria group bacterium]